MRFGFTGAATTHRVDGTIVASQQESLSALLYLVPSLLSSRRDLLRAATAQYEAHGPSAEAEDAAVQP
jgi:hypothetical protein